MVRWCQIHTQTAGKKSKRRKEMHRICSFFALKEDTRRRHRTNESEEKQRQQQRKLVHCRLQSEKLFSLLFLLLRDNKRSPTKDQLQHGWKSWKVYTNERRTHTHGHGRASAARDRTNRIMYTPLRLLLVQCCMQWLLSVWYVSLREHHNSSSVRLQVLAHSSRCRRRCCCCCCLFVHEPALSIIFITFSIVSACIGATKHTKVQRRNGSQRPKTKRFFLFVLSLSSMEIAQLSYHAIVSFLHRM